MAGVLERIRWPQNRPEIDRSFPAPRLDRRILELQTAKEILAEVFSVRISDVDEMIRCRFDEARFKENSYAEIDQWPREFSLAE